MRDGNSAFVHLTCKTGGRIQHDQNRSRITEAVPKDTLEIFRRQYSVRIKEHIEDLARQEVEELDGSLFCLLSRR